MMARNTNTEDKSSPGNHDGHREDVMSRKKNLTLDFQSHNFGKRSKFDIHKNSAPVLSSPDIKKLKLRSPELESLIIQQNGMNSATPTPSAPNNMLFPKLVTEEQEQYARGFVDALNELHGSDSSQGGNPAIDISNSSSNSMTYTDLDPQSLSSRHAGGFPSLNSNYNSLSPLGVVIKDEPQTVPSISDSPNLSPIDMECQEIIKLERKRMRNRVAASKCRRRKLERIARLEDKVRLLKGENSDLSAFVAKLKDQVCQLKRQVLEHVNSGCQIMNYC